MKKAVLIFASLFLTQCATPSKPTYEPTPSGPKGLEVREVLQKLNMDRSIEELGYEERRFDTCDLGYDRAGQCQRKHAVQIHFRLQCRDSVGTVESVSNIELIPVTSHHIRWRVGYYTGSTGTNSEGYGQIAFISPGSSRDQRLSLTVRENSLGVTASEVSRVIVPRDWCE